MRHWLWYKTDGEIGGDITIGGGWDTALDFDDDASTDATVIDNRAGYTGKTGFSGFIAYDCPCPATDVWCEHPAKKVNEGRVDTTGPTLEDKPVMQLQLDAVDIAHDSQTDKVPAATVTLAIDEAVASTIPDAVQVRVANIPGWAELLETSPQDVSFTSGSTPDVTLKAPAQGLVGAVSVKPLNPKNTVGQRVKVRGWT